MTDKEKEIQAIYTKYAKTFLEKSKNMTPEEEKKYIDENEPKMFQEIKEIIEKYKEEDKNTQQ